MGMFNYLRCEAALPLPQFASLEFQTKDIDPDFMDQYVIRADGSVWTEEYDTEDHSDPNAEGLARIIGAMTRVNKRWVPATFTAEVNFYNALGRQHSGWIEFKAHILRGQLHGAIELVEHREPDPAEEARREAEWKAFWEAEGQSDDTKSDENNPPTDEPKP